MKNKICTAIAVCCAIWILGLAGSSDLGTIGFAELVAQVALALTICAASLWVGGYFE